MDPSSRSIYAALAGNVAVAAVKLGAFFLGGSAAMLMEGIHSVIDTANQGLLLLGAKLGRRAPDKKHPFGYGMESFFWTFVVGVVIFALGGTAGIYQGIEKLRHPAALEHLPLTLIVLGLSFVFEALSFRVSWRESERGRPKLTRKRHARVSLVQFIHKSPDPGVFEVLAEGIASLLGLVLAALGVIGASLFHWRFADGASALAIGALLMALSGVILAESRSLLTGEAVSDTILEGIREIIAADRRVAKIEELKSMYLGPDEILLAATLAFDQGMTGKQIRDASDEMLDRLQEVEPRVMRLFLRAAG